MYYPRFSNSCYYSIADLPAYPTCVPWPRSQFVPEISSCRSPQLVPEGRPGLELYILGHNRPYCPLSKQILDNSHDAHFHTRTRTQTRICVRAHTHSSVYKNQNSTPLRSYIKITTSYPLRFPYILLIRALWTCSPFSYSMYHHPPAFSLCFDSYATTHSLLLEGVGFPQ